jgi:nucleotide-binding universal stress UspA family protein
MKHAAANVLLVRETAAITGWDKPLKKTARLRRVLLATDGSRHSEDVTQFIIDLPLPLHCDIIVVTVLQSYIAALLKTPTLDFKTNQELLSALQAAEEKQAGGIVAKSEKKLRAKGYKTASLVIRGGAAECILAAAKEYNTDIVALGSRGLTGLELLLLGSVAERVARYANCSVLIGRAAR